MSHVSESRHILMSNENEACHVGVSHVPIFKPVPRTLPAPNFMCPQSDTPPPYPPNTHTHSLSLIPLLTGNHYTYTNKHTHSPHMLCHIWHVMCVTCDTCDSHTCHTWHMICWGTGWRRFIACLKLQVILRQRATNYRALLREMTFEDQASYDSTPYTTL